ncbi:organic cation transporter protein-like [Pieris brassicae]|uniref:organic cation transporter protein-like n=1 Tax=Pieris brassicae TaxID=7116 RepID=UPI001E65F356|nr:organic cation transporter protein-like [Pieris brassicae]
MTSEDILETVIGRFGKYQVVIYLLVTVGRLPSDYQLSNVVFLVPNVEYVCMDEGAYNLTNHCPCDNPVYDTSTIHSSVPTTWNLICNKRHLGSLSQSVLQAGILTGSLAYGHISDRYGRRPAILLAFASQLLFVSTSAVVPYLWMFIVCRFLIGISCGGSLICCYVMIMELSGKTFRPYLTGLIEIAYTLSYATLPGIAYFVRDWNYLQLSTSLPWLFVLLYYNFLPESPRWLITMGRKEEAVEVLTYIAKKNKNPTDNITTIVEKEALQCSKVQNNAGSYLDLFKTSKMRRYTLINGVVWFCCSHTFFGINQYIGRLPGNIYVNVFISAVSIVPGLFLVVVASLYCSRKVSLVLSFAAAGLTLLVFIFIPSQMTYTIIGFAILGQMINYVSFVLIYLYTSEVFPTVVRNSAMGFVSMCARIGGFIAPFVVDIEAAPWVSVLIFSAVSFLAGFMCLPLRETKGIVLLNTIEEIEKYHKKTKPVS